MLKRIFFLITSLFILLGSVYFAFTGRFDYYIGEALFQFKDYKNAKKFYEKTISTLELKNLESQISVLTNYRIGKIYGLDNNDEKEFEFAKKALPFFKQNTRIYSSILYLIGLYDILNRQFEVANSKINEASIYFKDDIDNINQEIIKSLCITHFQIHSIQLKKHEREKAFVSIENSAFFAEHIDSNANFDKFKTLVFKAYAISLEEQNKPHQAEAYYKKALNLTDSDCLEYINIIKDMGINYSRQGKNQEEMECYLKILQYYEKYNNNEGKALFFNLIAYNKVEQKNNSESLKYALKALENLNAVKQPAMKAAILHTVACAYQLNQDDSNSEKYIKLAIENGEKDPRYDLKDKSTNYKLLGDLLEKRGDHEEAKKAWDHASKLLINRSL